MLENRDQFLKGMDRESGSTFFHAGRFHAGLRFFGANIGGPSDPNLGSGHLYCLLTYGCMHVTGGQMEEIVLHVLVLAIGKPGQVLRPK